MLLHSRQPAPQAGRSAFTLIEVLVSVSIIAVLISILLSGLKGAREASLRVKCGSNLKQINYGLHMFANEHKDSLCSLNGPLLDSPEYPTKIECRWFGGVGYDKQFYPQHGLMYRQLKNADVGGCDSLVFDDKRSNYGPVDYAYNRMLGLGTSKQGLGVKMTKVKRPGETVAFFDSVRFNNWNYTPGEPDRTPFGDQPTRHLPSFHARHGKQGNVAWLDGHVSVERPAWFPSYTRYTVEEIPLLKQHNIGDIDRDGDHDTDELFDLQ